MTFEHSQVLNDYIQLRTFVADTFFHVILLHTKFRIFRKYELYLDFLKIKFDLSC